MITTKRITGLKDIAHLYKNYFFDLDGVLWKGQESVPGSFQILQYLRQQQKNLYFVTNSSVNGRTDLMKKFARFGFKVAIQQCFPSSYISALYIKQKYPQIKKIMAFGSTSMANQFQSHGFEVKHIKQSPEAHSLLQISQKYLDLSIQAIVVGWDNKMTFSKQCLIGFHIQHGIKFLGTNPDKYTMIGDYKIPGAGSIIAAIQTGFNTKAEIMGKPNTFIIDHILKQKQLNKIQCIMIGDNRETDILFGNNAGISTLCVLSGVTQIEQLKNQQKLKQKAVPTYFSQNLKQ